MHITSPTVDRPARAAAAGLRRHDTTTAWHGHIKALADAHKKHEFVRMSESRCDDCKDKTYQCWRCKNTDDDTRKALKLSAKLLKQTTKQNAAEDKAVKAAVKASLRQKKRKTKASSEELKQDRFLAVVRKQFLVKNIPRDGHCLFAAFSAGYNKLFGVQMSVPQLRGEVADFLIQSKGKVPGLLYDQFKEHNGEIVMVDRLQFARNVLDDDEGPCTLEAYAALLRDNLYGGDVEVAALAHLYNVQVHVYSWHYYHDHNVFDPQYFGAITSERHMSLLFEQDFANMEGRRDHYDLVYSDHYLKWREYMRRMPEWNKDIGPCEGPAGRGVKALRDFRKGEVIMYYDGHRVDERGNVVFERAGVKQVFDAYGYDPSATPYQKCYSVSLCCMRSSTLAIDGYGLTLALFDSETVVGRGALANSGTPITSNMKIEWHDAPDLPMDLIDHVRDKEAFLVARRDIRYVFPPPPQPPLYM
jgi:hypothetical protein